MYSVFWKESESKNINEEKTPSFISPHSSLYWKELQVFEYLIWKYVLFLNMKSGVLSLY